MLPSDVHRLIEMRRMGEALERIERMIAESAELTLDDIAKIMEAVARDSYAEAAEIFDASKDSVYSNKRLRSVVSAQAELTAETIRNLSRTTIDSNLYREAVSRAVHATQSGVTDYSSAIRAAVRRVAAQGLRVRYESGVTRRLDTAVRQNTLDAVRQINQKVQEQLGKELGATGYELSAHALCAPDHLHYQGRQYTLAAYDKLQENLDRPIGQWNCKHFATPIMYGITKPAYTDEQLRELENNSNEKITIDGKTRTRYEWTQVQREIETECRKEADTITLAKATGDKKLVAECNGNLNGYTQLYTHISDKAGIEPQYWRMRGYITAKR
jgi:hypothetical protein